jgi:hypothetical protein
LIKVKNIEVFNFEGALRGMRNPLESWNQLDSYWDNNQYIIGEKDLSLALKLVKAGTDHSKFMRQLFVSMNITAPLYWWHDMDQYKISTTTNSTSVRKLGNRLLTIEDFSWDYTTLFREQILNNLNERIIIWQKNKDKKLWMEINQDMPKSYNYLKTWSGNYQILRNIYFARKNHTLQEFRDFCKIIETLPYSELIIIERK